MFSPQLGAQAIYVDHTQNANLIGTHEPAAGHPSVMMVGGGTVGDFNSDGWPDVFVPSGGTRPDFFFINDGDGTFTESAAAWGLIDLHMGVGSAVGDFNGDGWQDLYVCSFGPAGSRQAGHNKLYRNNGDGSFTDVAIIAGVNAPSVANNCYGAAFGDYDRDGDLDLFVAAYSFGQEGNKLYRNNGDETFTDVTAAAGILDVDTTRGFVPNFVDLNQDGHTDIILIADTGTSKVYFNNGKNAFTNATQCAPDLSLPNAMGLATGDFDNDMDLDFYVSDIYYPVSGIGGNRLFINDGSGKIWNEVASSVGVKDAGWGWGVVATDMDNDGWLDLASTNGWFSSWDNYPTRIFHNSQGKSFVEVAANCGLNHLGQGRSLLRLDADRDGDEDLIITESNGPISYFKNETDNGNYWLRISFDTQGVDDLAPHGLGTEVIVRRGSKQIYRQLDSSQSYLGQSELALHIGLGQYADVLNEVEVRWADGQITIMPNVASNQHLVVRAARPLLTASQVQAQAQAMVTLSGFTPFSKAVVAVSDVGGGPVSTPCGDLFVSAPFQVMTMKADAQGQSARSFYVPGWVSGSTFWLHAFDSSASTFSNPLSVTVP
ncbi:MAG: CRTAC1 family protein [Planctomycetes bacterium]|nr:CRTAC1 family protein [Planctomycetota bacterium]